MQPGRAAVERSGKRVARFDDHVVTPYRSERLIKQLLARAAAGQRTAHRRTVDVGGRLRSRCIGFRFSRGRPIGTASVPSASSRCPVAARGRGTRASHARYVEIFDLVEPAEFAAQATARRERGDQKQMALSEVRSRTDSRSPVGRLGVDGRGRLASGPHVSAVPGVLVR